MGQLRPANLRFLTSLLTGASEELLRLRARFPNEDVLCEAEAHLALMAAGLLRIGKVDDEPAASDAGEGE